MSGIIDTLPFRKLNLNPHSGTALADFSLEGSLHSEFFAIASSGLEYHLAQAGSEERDVGMIIAQMILNKLRPDAENKLNFEFYDSKFEKTFQHLISRESSEDDSFLAKLRNKATEIKEDIKLESDSESLDSDDFEFEQFDWSTSSTSKYAPKYILEANDTLSGFGLPPNVSHTEKANRTAAALSAIPKLARVNSDQAAQIGKMTLHIFQIFYMQFWPLS